MEMIVKSICKMQSGKASGLSGVVTEMLKASSDLYIELMAYLTNSVVRGDTMLSEWDVSFIFTDTIFILRQVQEKNIGKSFNLYFAFVDLEKAFNKVGFMGTRHTRVDCTCGSDNVSKCKKLCEDKQLVQ